MMRICRRRWGGKANSSTVTALSNRVTNTETVANSKNRVWRQNNPPANNVTVGDIWFQTNNKNKPFRYNGSDWISIEDGDIPELRDDLTAQANALVQATARVNRASATGRLRITSVAAPEGAQSRIGPHAEANSEDASHSAALYLTARSDGFTDITAVANRFAIVTGSGANAARKVPFIVRGGTVYMDVAVIEDLSVGRLKVADRSFSTWDYSYTAGQITTSASAETVLQTLVMSKGRAEPMPLFFSVNSNSMGWYQLLLYRGGTLIFSTPAPNDPRADLLGTPRQVAGVTFTPARHR